LRFSRTLAVHLALAAILAAGSARAEDIPVPAPRPALSDEPPVPMPQPRPDIAAATPATSIVESACRARLTADIAVVEALPPVTGAEGCGIEDPVLLSAVMTKEGKRLSISPPVTVACPLAEELARWLREDVTDIAASLGAPLVGIASGQGYQCRGINGIAGMRMSQHGRGLAMDLRAFLLANGLAANPTDMTLPREFRERIKASACARFTTVLGPGSDGHHEIYAHVDVAARRNGYRICQWEVREIAVGIPLPRERPADAPPRTAAR
jgi:hypothetical protein